MNDNRNDEKKEHTKKRVIKRNNLNVDEKEQLRNYEEKG